MVAVAAVTVVAVVSYFSTLGGRMGKAGMYEGTAELQEAHMGYAREIM